MQSSRIDSTDRNCATLKALEQTKENRMKAGQWAMMYPEISKRLRMMSRAAAIHMKLDRLSLL